MTTLALLFLLQAPVAPPAAPVAAVSELLAVKNVYILPMGNGFDQFLANAVSRKGVLQVVTDPAKADVIFTDKLGKGFELKMSELYPEPKPEEPAKPPKPLKPEKGKDGKDAKDKDDQGEEPPAAFDMKNLATDRSSSFGRGKGNYFLVNRATRNVIWSLYAKPSTMRPEELNSTAKDVAGELAKAIERQAKGQK